MEEKASTFFCCVLCVCFTSVSNFCRLFLSVHRHFFRQYVVKIGCFFWLTNQNALKFFGIFRSAKSLKLNFHFSARVYISCPPPTVAVVHEPHARSNLVTHHSFHRRARSLHFDASAYLRLSSFPAERHGEAGPAAAGLGLPVTTAGPTAALLLPLVPATTNLTATVVAGDVQRSPGGASFFFGFICCPSQ